MKKTTVIKILAVLMVICAAPALFADGVFMKDGSIKEGAIDKRTEDSVTIITSEDLKLQIPMRKVLRIIAGSDYKKIYKVTVSPGRIHKGHIVFETREYYVFRKNLRKNKEEKFYKYEVSMIADEEGNLRQDQVADKLKGYSPSKAAWLSLVPMYSGSFIAGKKPVPGFIFAITKSAAFLGPILYPLIGTAAAGQSFSNSNSIEDRYFKKTHYQIYAGISLGIWALLTAGDALYSYYYIKDINKNFSTQSSIPGTVTWAIVPRVTVVVDAFVKSAETVEGINVIVSTRF